MPSKSKSQRRLMGWALSIKKKGKKSDAYMNAPENIKKLVDTMTKKELEDFATTKEKNLPDTVKEHIMLFEEFNSIIPKGTKSEEVKNLQNVLHNIGFTLDRYGIDGILGNETIGQVKNLMNALKKTGHNDYYFIIGSAIPRKAYEKIISLPQDKKAVDDIKEYRQEQIRKIKSTDVIAGDIIAKNIPQADNFIEKLKDISAELDINPNWLIAVMYKESGINHRAVNKSGGASGLIQFMPDTAKNLGTNIDSIRSMSAVEQLEYVKKYFMPFKNNLNSFPDLYLTTFYPYALNKDDDYVIGSERSRRYARKVANQNKAIDLNRDNKITKKEFYEYVWKNIKPEWKYKFS